MTTTETRLLTADDLLRLYGEGVRGELIRGVLCETMATGQRHGRIVMNLGAELRSFAKPRRLGTLVGSGSGAWLERDSDTVREVASPSDSRRGVNDNARMWLSHGVRVVWVVHPDTRTVDVHEADEPIATFGETDALDGADLLPGFRIDVRAIFEA